MIQDVRLGRQQNKNIVSFFKMNARLPDDIKTHLGVDMGFGAARLKLLDFAS